jgi:hypothetical protein
MQELLSPDLSGFFSGTQPSVFFPVAAGSGWAEE